MNVLNRKMFRNNDARRALSEMGGIVSFVNGGNSEPVQMYVINVPGFTQPGEYLKVREDTLMLLNDTIPHLMSLRDTMVEPAEDLGGYVNVKPGDAIVRTRLSNRPGMTTAESDLEGNLLPPEPKPVKAESLMDRLRGTFQSARSVTPYEAISDIDMTTSISDSVMGPNPEMGMSSVIADAAAELARTGNVSRFTRSELDDILNPTITPAASESLMDRLRGTVQSARSVTPFEAISDIEVPPSSDITIIDGVPVQNSFMTTPYSEEYGIIPPNVAEQINPGILAEKKQEKLKDAQGDLAEAQEDLVDSQDNFENNPTGENLTAVVDAKKKIAVSETAVEEAKENVPVSGRGVFALEGPEAGGTVLTEYSKAVEEVYNAATKKEPDVKAGEEALRKTLELKMRPETGTDRASLLRTATKKDDTEPEKKSTPASDKDRLEAKYQELADLFGIKPEKKADMYELMAMIGFAMAAGESPSALKNIADAFLIGAQIRREDAKEDEAFDQKLKLLAFEYLQDEKTALRASQQELAKEQRLEDRETRKMQLDFMLRANLEEIKSNSLRSAVRDVLTASIGVTGQLPTSEMVNDAMLLMGPLFGENQLISTDDITGGNNERDAMASQLFGD
jgi:hypothetical protein